MTTGFYLEKGDQHKQKFVFLEVTDRDQIVTFLGQQRLYLKVEVKDDIVEDESNPKVDKSNPKVYVQKLYIWFIRSIYKNLNKLKRNKDLTNEENNKISDLNNDLKKLKNEEDVETLVTGIRKETISLNYKDEFSKFIKIIKNIPKYKCIRPKDEANIAENCLKEPKVYVNVLETGLFQYLTYSHRSSIKFNTLGYGYGYVNNENKENKEINENDDIKKNNHINENKENKEINENDDIKKNKHINEKKETKSVYKIIFIKEEEKKFEWFVIPSAFEYKHNIVTGDDVKNLEGLFTNYTQTKQSGQ
ncbi:17492_t:CDS:1 [Racocetra fulgida]|uniref:17492_t:CDS:1 n=1 Tax=Racocetra fulgida TaxID=60492 RepID=A0A9N9H0E8_9GLOM|nr:17492_t:CDS:1 [Racocetra fulgida]